MRDTSDQSVLLEQRIPVDRLDELMRPTRSLIEDLTDSVELRMRLSAVLAALVDVAYAEGLSAGCHATLRMLDEAMQ